MNSSIRRTNNLTLNKEIIVKSTYTPRAFSYAVSILFFCFGVYDLYLNRFLRGFSFIIMAGFFSLISKLEPKGPKILLKISDEGLWTRNRGKKRWESIIYIKFRYPGSKETFMDIYMSNDVVADEEVSLYNANISLWRLKRILKKYTKVESNWI